MFTNLRKSAQGFFAKLILILLTAMFVIWGIGDVFRNMGGPDPVAATVGKMTITVQEIRERMHSTHKDTHEVFINLINESLIAQEAKAMGIEVSDDEVARFISALPEFQGSDGKFDKTLYLRMLNNLNLDEAHFVADMREEITGRLLTESFNGSIQVPGDLLESLYKSQEEQRTANLFLIPVAAVASGVPVASDTEVKAYYDAHNKEFMAPEYRTLTYVALPLADVQAKIVPSDDDIKHAYEDRIQEYTHPEKRQIDQMVFKSEDEAKKAADKIKAGTSFDAVAKSSDILNKTKLSIGELTEADLPPEGEKAGLFKLKEGEVSAPVQSDFGWHVFFVRKVTSAGPVPLEQVRAELAKDVAARAAQDTSVKLMNGFEDALAGGSTLDQAAEKIGQKAQTIGPVNHEGNTPEGKKADLPPYPAFLNTAFATAEKEHSAAVQAMDGSYFLVRVDSITPEHVKPFEEVKPAVQKALFTQQTQARFEKILQSISEQMLKGKKPQDVLTENGITVAPVPSGNLKHDTQAVPAGPLKDQKLPRGVISELFRIHLHDSTHPYPMGDGNYVLATLTGVTPPPVQPDPAVIGNLNSGIKETLSDEALHAYLNYLRSKYPIVLKPGARPQKQEADGE